MSERVIATNRRARRDYHVMDKFEAGIELRGTEVKALRQAKISLKDSHCIVDEGQIFLIGTHIAPYEQGNIYNHDPERPRRLLMHKHEIIKLGVQIAEKGLTIIPLQLYFNRGKVKVQIALCKGKHTVDKRNTIRERDEKREMERAVKDGKYS